MDFDDFEFGPEELGILFAMSEELTERKKEQYRHIMGEDISHDSDDIDDDFSDIKFGGKNRNLSSFERYINDICSGKRDLFDSEDDEHTKTHPCKKPEHKLPAIPIEIEGINIYQHHMVSEKYIDIIIELMKLHPEHNIKNIVFNGEGFPKEKGEQIFAVYIRRSGSIAINLQRHFDNAAIVASEINTSFSIRGLFWNSMLSVFIHEMHHSITQVEDDDPIGSERDKIEKEATSWSDAKIREIAHLIDIEPPPLTEEPFLYACFHDILKERTKEGYEDWVKHQKLLIDSDILYWDADTYLAYPTMKHLLGLIEK